MLDLVRLGLARRGEVVEDRLLERLARLHVAQAAHDQHPHGAQQQQDGEQLRRQPEACGATGNRISSGHRRTISGPPGCYPLFSVYAPPDEAARTSAAVLALRNRTRRRASSSSMALAFLMTAGACTGGNFTAPFSSIWISSPGATSMPPTDTGTLTACTAISPWPAVTPPSSSWKRSLRMASMSRDGPLDRSPTQPTAIIELTIISPASPALAISSGGHFCWITRMVGLGMASSASTTFMNESRPAKLGSGSP